MNTKDYSLNWSYTVCDLLLDSSNTMRMQCFFPKRKAVGNNFNIWELNVCVFRYMTKLIYVSRYSTRGIYLNAYICGIHICA